MSKQNRFWWHDTTLCVGTERESDRSIYAALLNALRHDGFSIGQDKTVSQLIRRDYHAGKRKDLLLVSHTYVTGCKIEFYQNLVFDNPNGGQYDFDKFKKMPYLIRLRFLWEKRTLERILQKRGFVDKTKPVVRGLEFVEQQRQELRDFQGPTFYDGPRASYNATDGDGRQLRDGDLRHFYTWGGSLRRGTVYHHINNMWWAVVNSSEVHNIACWHFFEYDPSKHPARKVEDPARRIKPLLAKAVSTQDFERAIKLRDALRAVEAQAF